MVRVPLLLEYGVDFRHRPHEPADPVCKQGIGERKNAKILGMTFLWGFKKDGKDWSGGKILDPANGKTNRSTM